ncbi:MAG: apolipoprotein N-acyltransferase [Aestuariivirga sp.]|uniref:apolipoprotein N-acyltransferase n=1 Tax=Aestuariivirga sp. TaxID=2650926 RepID=UPI0038D1AC92
MIRLAGRISGLPGPLRGALCFAAGLLAALGLSPIGAWPLAFLGFPLFLSLLAGAKRGFLLGWLFGLGYFSLALHWIAFAFLVEAETYLWMMPFMLGILAGGMALYWGLAALAAKWLGGRGASLALAFAASLGAAEWLRGHLFTGFPWAAPGQMVDAMGGLAQLCSVIGMTGLTLLIVLWASLPYAFLADQRRAVRVGMVGVALLLPLSWGWGAWRLAEAKDSNLPGLAFRIIQPNVPQEQKWREDNARAIFEDLLRLSGMPTAERPDGIGGVTHLLWPESAVPFLIDESPGARAELAPLLGGRTVLITGAIRVDRTVVPEPSVHNGVIVFDGTAEPVARYDKWRLVPGGEFLPLGWLLEPMGFRRVVETPGSFTAGPGPRTLKLPGGLTVAPLVCYEVIFPHRLLDPAARPQAIVNVTNDGWFGRSIGPYQHLAQTRLRAIEQGLPVLRAANTGVSAVIDSHGRIREQLPLGAQGVIDAAVPEALDSTFYGRWGDLSLLLIILAVFATGIHLKQL